MLKQKNKNKPWQPTRLPKGLGFALIELLVAVSIFAVVAAVVYTTLYTGIRAYNKTQQQLELNQEINQVLDRMSLELRNCYDAEHIEGNEESGFTADAQSISFFTIVNKYSEGSFKKMIVRISYNFGDEKLFKKTQLDKGAFLDPENFSEEELISNIKELSFQYLYSKEESPDAEKTYEWKSAWQYKEFIPQGVRIQITKYDPKTGLSINLKRDIFIAQGKLREEKP